MTIPSVDILNGSQAFVGNPKNVLEGISGARIEKKIIELAAIGGVQIEPTVELNKRFSVSRLALSDSEFAARDYLTREMESVGMSVTRHPLGLIATYEGTDNSLPPVIVLSHFDSVNKAGMYDGTVGVLSGIEMIRRFNELGLRFNRRIIVLALTGEEASRFNRALFGSAGIFHGLTDADLASHREGDISIGEAIKAAGFSVEEVRKPVITKENAFAAVELHVEQTNMLEKTYTDLAVVNAIAAPNRNRVTLGDKLEFDNKKHTYSKIFSLSVRGKSGHSGATPMGKAFRADGLVATSEVLYRLGVIANAYPEVTISIGDIKIDAQALSKIPGCVDTIIRIAGENEDVLNKVRKELDHYISERSVVHKSANVFPESPINMTEQYGESNIQFYNSDEMFKRAVLASRIILNVGAVCTKIGDNVVGTVGTIDIKDGQVVLGLDIRGIHSESRDKAVAKILLNAETASKKSDVAYDVKKLPGSGDPVQMSRELVTTAKEQIKRFEIGSYVETFSAAGHDVMNAARTGIPSIMLFVPSQKGGISHTPEEYTSAKYLGIGAKALTALVIELALRK